MRRVDLVPILRTALLLLAIVHLAIVVLVSFKRCFHPFELEWMEGAMVDHVERVLAGKKLYVQPSIEFVPFIYGPLYFWLSAAVAKVTGVGFLPLRLVSIGSMLGSFFFIHRLVHRETDDRAAGVIAAGAFAASYMKSAQFLDIGRVDSLSLVVSLAAIDVMRNAREKRWAPYVGAALLGLSFMTKQSSFVLAAALIAYEVWVERKRAIPFVVATLVATFGAAFLMDWAHDGWFRYYTWELPRSHPFVQQALAGFWTDDLAPVYAIAAVFGGYFLIAANPARPHARLFHFLAAGGLVAFAWIGRLHDGGWPNVLIPAFAALSILFGLGLASALRASAAEERVQLFVVVAAIAQLAVTLYNPMRTLPKRNDVAVGKEFIRRVRAVEGEVFIPNHSWYARMADKPTHAHRMAMDDVMRGDPHGEGVALAAALRTALAKKKWGAIFLDDEYFEADALRTYMMGPPPFPTRDGFYPPTGIHVRPQKMLIKLP